MTLRCLFMGMGLYGLLALSTAWIAEYEFGIKPCVLCFYERYVIMALTATSLGGLLLPRWRCQIFGLLIIFCLSGAALTFYHTGVEQHWWEGLAACKSTGPTANSLEEMRAQIYATPPPRCDEITWRLLGVSATIWLFLQFVVLLGISHLFWWRGRTRV